MKYKIISVMNKVFDGRILCEKVDGCVGKMLLSLKIYLCIYIFIRLLEKSIQEVKCYILSMASKTTPFVKWKTP